MYSVTIATNIKMILKCSKMDISNITNLYFFSHFIDLKRLHTPLRIRGKKRGNL